VADAAEKWGEATLELNGYSFNLTDADDLQMLEIVMQHGPSADKVLDLFDGLRDVVKEPVEPEPEVTDARALAEIEAARRALQKHYHAGFLLGVWTEQYDGVSYRYADGRYAAIAEAEREAAA
jgi:hypothetical protein